MKTFLRVYVVYDCLEIKEHSFDDLRSMAKEAYTKDMQHYTEKGMHTHIEDFTTWYSTYGDYYTDVIRWAKSANVGDKLEIESDVYVRTK